ncbi:MAG: nickel pincer cofactor biosynthesis protein LarC [candidate division Zixibacteria bacterium]|nr:nickel pincer cofactor biosynthesis protein LarC [candidate division Zixibacteria bacterium]
MKIAYFDTICGAAGDMIIASMLNCGLDFERLKLELAKLPLDGYNLRKETTSRHHIAATRFIVEIEETHSHRRLKDIENIINDSSLKEKIKMQAVEIFRKLAKVEAKAHGETVDNVHFHEVGMVDAIIDVCGAVIGLDLLGIEKAYCSPLTVGHGIVNTQHGTMPVPAPAVSELIVGYPVVQVDISGEITTPTGAVLLTTLCTFAKPGQFMPQAIGYGAGTKDHKALPNFLRLFIGESQAELEGDEIALIETNLDRTPPEQIGYLMNNLFAAKALDVFITPIQMKKNRPGQMLSVLCCIEDEKKLAGIIFSSGATLGLRRKRVQRWKLPREKKTISTKYGEISVKLANYEGKALYFPEYESVAKTARQAMMNFDDVYFEILSQLRKES